MLPRLCCSGKWRHLCPSVSCLVELGCGEVESTKDLSCHVVVTNLIGQIVAVQSFVSRRGHHYRNASFVERRYLS